MIRQIQINGYDKNFSYFIIDEKSKGCAVVDPGDPAHLIAEIEQDSLVPKCILITHSHFDHVSGVNEMVMRYGVPVYIHKNARGRTEIEEEVFVYVEDKEVIEVGNIDIRVMHTPGHIDDAVCYHIEPKKSWDGIGKLITGDTLFVEGCGRCDLEFSNVDDMYDTLNRIKKLSDKTEIYPGHNYGSKKVSTLAWEKKHNKYMKCDGGEEFRTVRMPGRVV